MNGKLIASALHIRRPPQKLWCLLISRTCAHIKDAHAIQEARGAVPTFCHSEYQCGDGSIADGPRTVRRIRVHAQARMTNQRTRLPSSAPDHDGRETHAVDVRPWQ